MFIVGTLTNESLLKQKQKKVDKCKPNNETTSSKPGFTAFAIWTNNESQTAG